MAVKQEQKIYVPQVEVANVNIRVIGDSPLIMHRWSEKAKKEMRDKQMKVAKTKGREAKNPIEDFIQSMYWLTETPTEMTQEAFDEAISNGARFGFPTVAFKAAANYGAYRAGIIKNTTVVKGAWHIFDELTEIISEPPVMREDMVKVGMGTADLRYRGEFRNWSTTLHITYVPSMIELDQLVNLINIGGMTCGVGEWRVEKNGEFGSFHVE